MQHILILGAGKSATVLIDYLLDSASKHGWTITLGDLDQAAAAQKIKGQPHAKAVYFNADDATLVNQYIAAADVVVSLLPAFVHPVIAKACVSLGKHFVSASYVSDAMRALHDEAVKKNIILLNEIGLDPGIDHMSAMSMIDEAHAKGATITAFTSYTGGLIAPESDTNPWQYKFTWNPRNVVLAGQGTAKYLQEHQYKYIPYHKLFQSTVALEVPDYGVFEGYPNRDSLGYREIYGLEHTGTIIRGTLRKAGFCKAWDVFVQLGMTDDSYKMEQVSSFTWAQFTEAFLPAGQGRLDERLQQFLHITDQEVMDKLRWLGLFEETPIFETPPAETAYSPAQILQRLLESKWGLAAGDKDMCVMMHVMEYTLNQQHFRQYSSMVAIGTDEVHTAMAKTVGLPAAIATERIMLGLMKQTGVVIPVTADIYVPLLQALASEHNIVFRETTVTI